MNNDLELELRIAKLRDAERLFRRDGKYERADRVRQLADAYELRGPLHSPVRVSSLGCLGFGVMICVEKKR